MEGRYEKGYTTVITIVDYTATFILVFTVF